MEPRLVALKLILEELDMDADISDVQKRKGIQKAIFLGQMAGVDLGYRYGWYIMGPYSPSLTRDYYDLSEALSLEENSETERFDLNAEVKNQLKKIKGLFSVPPGVHLSKEDWLELLSSILFLRKVSALSDADIKERIQKEKTNLYDYIDAGFEQLRQADLLNI